MYRGRSITRNVRIGAKKAVVDSYLEERILNHLETNGFNDRWSKHPVGINRGKSNYTPDLELSVEFKGMTHRAIVEIKPERRFLTNYIKNRMIGIAKHYPTELLLLYAEKENRWYRIDIKSGLLSDFGFPVPGKIPIKKLFRPLSVPATQVYNHHYKKAAWPAFGIILLRFTVELLQAPFTSPKRSRKSRRRKRK